MGSHEYCGAALRSLVYQFPELATCNGVDTASRLIKENHFRAVDCGNGERQFLLPAQWQRADQRVTFRSKVKGLEKFCRTLKEAILTRLSCSSEI